MIKHCLAPLLILAAIFVSHGCVPLEQIYSHNFSDGYYQLKESDGGKSEVYLEIGEDSARLFSVGHPGNRNKYDTTQAMSVDFESLKPGNRLYGSTFIRTSCDLDLSTVLLKYRPSAGNVPPQLNANVNGVLYSGFRKDYFRIKRSHSVTREESTFLRHTAFDLGVFAGIGITPVNPTVTMERTSIEYDGIVFQKGIAVFATYESLSVGLSLGFDNLLDRNRNIWLFNNKPWIGLVLGIANF